MAARRAPSGGLTSDDVTKLRAQVEAGRRPRVQLSGPQFSDDTSGTVSRIGNPDEDGADFVTVRVKVNGVTDELAFSPAELSLGRGPRAGASTDARNGRAADGSGTRPGNGTAGSDRAEQGVLTGTGSEPVSRTSSADGAPTADPATEPASTPAAGSADAATKPAGKAASAGAKPAARSSDTAAGSAAAKRRKPAAPKVSFTISSTGATWALTASRGAKGIAKSMPIAPGVVTGVAELLEQPALLEAVAEINETAWAEAQIRAEQLRAELDQLEAVLATHRFPR